MSFLLDFGLDSRVSSEYALIIRSVIDKLIFLKYLRLIFEHHFLASAHCHFKLLKVMKKPSMNLSGQAWRLELEGHGLKSQSWKNISSNEISIEAYY